MASKGRITVKMGTSGITSPQGVLDSSRIALFSEALCAARKAGYEVVVVTSGAIAAGFSRAGYSCRPTSTIPQQAAAALGQPLLMHEYARCFRAHGYEAAQILLTRRDFTVRESYNNAAQTLEALISKNAIPVINENDSVAVEELTFGDNDMLAALVATLLKSELVIFFTQADGVYSADPRENRDAVRLSRLAEITDAMLADASERGSSLGTGGIRAKLAAARFALSLGVPGYIGTLNAPEELVPIIERHGIGTYVGDTSRVMLNKKKQWIAYHSPTTGTLVIDDGARAAIYEHGKSLLPAGVSAIQGGFEAQEVVRIASSDGCLYGKGIVQYSAAQLQEALGKNTEFAARTLGVKRPEVVHRDDLVLF